MVKKFGSFVFACLVVCVGFCTLRAQENIRVMTYNILRYGAQGIGGCTPTPIPQRDSWFRDILTEVSPDIFGVNEIGPSDGAFSPMGNISQNILPNVPGKGPFYQATKILFNSQQDICNMMWYNTQKVGLSTQYLIPVAGSARPLDYYKFYYNTGENIVDSTFLHVVLVHFMASNTNQQNAQAAAIMDYFTSIGLSPTDDYMVTGDMNLSSSNSGPFQTLVNNGPLSLNDPLGISGNWTSNAYNYCWSQSTRTSSYACGSGGGLDDRFDVTIISDGLQSTAGNDISYKPGSYWVVGNPYSPNPSASSISTDLVGLSDHYPVVVDLEVSQAVGLAGSVDGNLQLFLANPVQGLLKGSLVVPGGFEGDYSFRLVGLDGRVAWERSVQGIAGEYALEFDLDPVSAGVYLFQVDGGLAAPISRKLVLLD